MIGLSEIVLLIEWLIVVFGLVVSKCIAVKFCITNGSFSEKNDLKWTHSNFKSNSFIILFLTSLFL